MDRIAKLLVEPREAIQEEQQAAGQSPKGRRLAVMATDAEKLAAWGGWCQTQGD